MDYSDFIKAKHGRIAEAGIEVKSLNKKLFPFQKDIVRTALKAGRYAIFADCGMGKTPMQLEWAHRISKAKGIRTIILTPLAVAGQTIQEAEKFGIVASRENDKEIFVTNYDQLDNIDLSQFGAVVLDESSILKSLDGKTKSALIESFRHYDYKLCCTATPSPNDPMELGNHAEFLGQMNHNEMLAMYFVHDGGETSKWRLKKHGVKPFYEWVSTWASVISKPSDMGYEDGGFVLPELRFTEHKLQTENKGESLFNDVAVSATEFNAELRRTKVDRLEKAAEIINESTEPFIVWVKQNEEADYLRAIIPDAVEVRGDDDRDYKEKMLLGFANGDFRVLITKAKIAQYGLNYQNCHNQVFPSLDFSFESFYQCVRRSYRFGQRHEVDVHIVTTDSMQNVIASIKKKEQQWKEMVSIITNLQKK